MENIRSNMRYREIMHRIKKLEKGDGEEVMVTLICLEKGKERRKVVPNSEAVRIVMSQGTKQLFQGGEIECKVIGVESGDDDGFIKALLIEEDIDPEE